MSRMRLGVGAFTLVSVLALSWFLPVIETDSAGAPIPTRQAAQEKQKILTPHFPYQPCRACRNQQRNYPM